MLDNNSFDEFPWSLFFNDVSKKCLFVVLHAPRLIFWELISLQLCDIEVHNLVHTTIRNEIFNTDTSIFANQCASMRETLSLVNKIDGLPKCISSITDDHPSSNILHNRRTFRIFIVSSSYISYIIQWIFAVVFLMPQKSNYTTFTVTKSLPF